MSKPSLSLMILVLIVAVPAAAQERTPTSPLDEEPASTQTRPVPPPAAPPVDTEPVEVGGALDTSLPRRALPTPSGGPPSDLAQLLPDTVSGVTAQGGLSEADVVARVRSDGLSARRAQASERAAQAGVRAARRGFVPQVNASFRYTRLSDYTPGTLPVFDTPGCLRDLASCQTAPENFQSEVVLQEPILDQYAARVVVGVPLSDYVGRRRHDLRAAQADAEAASAAREVTEDELELIAVQSYWEVVRARAQLALANESLAVAEQQAEEAQLRAEGGTATGAQAASARAQARGYARLVEVAESRQQLAEATLRDLLGMDESEALVLDADLAELPEAALASTSALRREATGGSARVDAANARARAADARADAARSAMYPSLSAAFGVDYANPNSRIFPQTTEFTATWDASVNLVWSFDGTLIAGARADQQRALAEEQRLAAEEARQSAGRRAIEAQGALQAAIAGVEAQRAAAEAADLAAQNARARRAAGVSTEVALRDAEAQRLSARLDLIDALVDAHVATARLEEALGRGRTEENR